MDGLNWAKVILVTLVMQVILLPAFWRDFIPLKRSTTRILRIICLVLLGPVYLLLSELLNTTLEEGSMIAVLVGLAIVPQGIVLSILYKRKKTKKIENAFPTLAKFIGYSLVTFILMLLGVYFFVYQHSLIIGMIFLILGICAAITMIIKIEKFLNKLHS